MPMARSPAPDRTTGFALVETLVTIVIVAFGLLGVAGLVTRSFAVEVEATQRAQASMLLQDMMNRIEANRTRAGAYVTNDTGINGDPARCDAADPSVKRDRCEWGQLLAGANEQIGNQNAGVLTGAIGCVYEIDGFNRIYAVAIAWQGMTTAAAPLVSQAFPPNGCGHNAYASENLRRVMTMRLRLGTLTPTT